VLNIFITIPVGQSVRDFLVLGVLDRLLAELPESHVVLLTPAHKVPEFQELCPRERVKIRQMLTPTGVGSNVRLLRLRRRLRHRGLIRRVLQWEAKRLEPDPRVLETFQESRPRIVVTTHPLTTHDYQIVMMARRLGIQTLGVVKSWDNVGKGLTSLAHLLSVWNPVNKKEAIVRTGYHEDEVTMNGATSFDPYYDPAWHLPREQFLRSLGLDPSRPVITLAAGGNYDRHYYGRDETYFVDDLLRMIASTPSLNGAQLVVRLHPTSHLEYFWRFWNRNDVVFSFASYIRAIGWCPLKNDIVQQANLLKHSDVVVTPASSWALEAAIFDTPTVCPVYSDIQPELAAAEWERGTLVRHFKPLADNHWIPITRSYEETRHEVEAAIKNPGGFAAGRKAIVDSYIYFRDGESAGRVAAWIATNARQAVDGKLRGL
jgi:hypothetical protein